MIRTLPRGDRAQLARAYRRERSARHLANQKAIQARERQARTLAKRLDKWVKHAERQPAGSPSRAAALAQAEMVRRELKRCEG